jgi:hypothetical protein
MAVAMTSFPLQPPAPTAPHSLPKLYVYVDETGDRGFSTTSSACFAMTALIVPAEEDWQTRTSAASLRALVGTSERLHWVEHFKAKRPERRARAARLLAVMPEVRVVHVIVDKATARLNRDGVWFYNYTAQLLLARVAQAARTWEGGPRQAIVRLGSVKGMDHAATLRHLGEVRTTAADDAPVPWEHLHWPPTWRDTSFDGIQLADIHAGLLNAALRAKPDETACVANLLRCKHQLHRSAAGVLLGHGVEWVGLESVLTGRDWWADWSAA